MILFVCVAHTVTEQWVLEDQPSVHRGPLSLEVICIIQMPLVGLAALNFWKATYTQSSRPNVCTAVEDENARKEDQKPQSP